MGQKKVLPSFQLNWQSTAPVPFSPNTPLTGTLEGAMAETNTIYTNVQDVTNIDNVGLELAWAAGDTGPTGTIQIMVSISGVAFFALTFDPALAQPDANSGGYVVNLNQLPFRYFFVQYTNETGEGTLTAFVCQKDLN